MQDLPPLTKTSDVCARTTLLMNELLSVPSVPTSGETALPSKSV